MSSTSKSPFENHVVSELLTKSKLVEINGRIEGSKSYFDELKLQKVPKQCDLLWRWATLWEGKHKLDVAITLNSRVHLHKKIQLLHHLEY